jgi:hypothetical protein
MNILLKIKSWLFTGGKADLQIKQVQYHTIFKLNKYCSITYTKLFIIFRLPFMINTKIIRKRLAALGKNKSVGPDGVSGKILKTGWGSHESIPCTVIGRNN